MKSGRERKKKKKRRRRRRKKEESKATAFVFTTYGLAGDFLHLSSRTEEQVQTARLIRKAVCPDDEGMRGISGRLNHIREIGHPFPVHLLVLWWNAHVMAKSGFEKKDTLKRYAMIERWETKRRKPTMLAKQSFREQQSLPAINMKTDIRD